MVSHTCITVGGNQKKDVRKKCNNKGGRICDFKLFWHDSRKKYFFLHHTKMPVYANTNYLRWEKYQIFSGGTHFLVNCKMSMDTKRNNVSLFILCIQWIVINCNLRRRLCLRYILHIHNKNTNAFVKTFQLMFKYYPLSKFPSIAEC